MTTVTAVKSLKDETIWENKVDTCTNTSFSCEFWTNQRHQMKNASLSVCVCACVWQSRQKILAGSGGERNLPRCQSTTCIVVLWHSKHLECSLCFEASSFLQKEITNQKGRQLCLRACKGGFVTARLPVWLPRPSGNFWDVGGEWKTLFPPFIFKWSSGNSLVILGRSHGMGLLLCKETLGQIR